MRLLCSLTLALVFVTSTALAQNNSFDGLWQQVDSDAARILMQGVENVNDELATRRFQPRSFRAFDLNPQVLLELTRNAPNESAARLLARADRPSQLTIPMPDNSFQRFELVESPVMSEQLAAKFPEIRSFRGRSLDDSSQTMRLDISPLGMHAQVIGPTGTVLVDPIEGNRYMSFAKRTNRDGSPFNCLQSNVDDFNRFARRAAGLSLVTNGDRLRTFRLAVACTGEYCQRFGGTKSGAMAAINSTINRVTGIYESEFCIRLELVDDNNEIVFTDAATDGFTNGNPGRMVDEAQQIIDRKIGDANYDIGHVFGTSSGGGNGYGPGPVGVSGQKAKGATTHDLLVGDPFNVDFVAHEMGHQFGGAHTFNGNQCNAAARSNATAVEPGSGSTIMAYAGICSSDNLQNNSNDYFHAASLTQIIETSRSASASVSTTGNSVPTVDAGNAFTIPVKTPFKLTASGSDPDVGDQLSYCWEQFDIGPAANVGNVDDGQIPLFRSFSPTVSRSRVFPKWSDILNVTQSTGEQMPTKNRKLNFRVTVRDNQSGGGGINSDDVQLTVVESAGPFVVTYPDTSEISSRLLEVKWNVADTDQSPIECKQVNILLSTDGGTSFNETLAQATENDGQELVGLPGTATNNLRILVESVDNIFFAVSPRNFSVQNSDSNIFVSRHAEKEAGENPSLTLEGKRRAFQLAALMSRVGVSKVYSTDFNRTVQTAKPTADAVGTTVEIYSSESNLVDELNSLSNNEKVLIIGHSNTIGSIVNGLGASDLIDVAEDEFDNLFSVVRIDSHRTLQSFKYSPLPTSTDSRIAVSGRLSFNAGRSPAMALPRVSPSFDSFGRAANPSTRFAKSDLPVKYFEQNWSPAESLEFYSLRQGSPIIRKVFFDALEQPDSQQLFRESDYLASFGFLPQHAHDANPMGYPIGFVGNESIEITCAACHTSRLTYQGQEYRLDGSQAMTDFESWIGELVRTIRSTLDDAPSAQVMSENSRIELDQTSKFGRFVTRVLGISNPSSAQVRIVKSLLENDYQRRLRYNDFNDYGKTFASDAARAEAIKHEKYGFGRLDALAAILNQATAEMLNQPSNAGQANAPVNYPAIWDAPQHHHVQWNGAVDNTATFGPLGRNSGQVIGVFGLVKPQGTLVGYDSSINFDAIGRAEELITKLWSPEWPREFGIDVTKVEDGKRIYQEHCASCHSIMDRKNPNRVANDVLVPIDRTFGPYQPLGTDPLTAQNWQDREASLEILAGKSVTAPFGDTFPSDPDTKVPSREILTHLVFNSIARSFVPWREELTIDDAHGRSMMLARVGERDTLMRYKARPLNGVWSTSPYLHNGSVLNMNELLTEPIQRKPTFRVGTTEYDPATLGFKDEGSFIFDATKNGNRSIGHAYGVELIAEDKQALIEFLKTL